MKRATLFALLVLVWVACGGEAEPDEGTAGLPPGGGGVGTEADLENAAIAAFEAFRSADDAAWFDLLTVDCRTDLGFPAVESFLDGRRFSIDLANIDLSGLEPGDVTITSFEGDSATVTLEVVGTAEPFRESVPAEWVYEDGWRMAECADIRPSSNDLSAEGTSPDDPIDYGFIADLDGWLINVTFATADDEEIIVELGGDPAASGNRLATVGIGLTYTGPESSIRYGDVLEFALVDGSTEYGTDASCETEQYGTLTEGAEDLAPGDSAVGIICRAVPEDAGELLLRVRHLGTGGERFLAMP